MVISTFYFSQLVKLPLLLTFVSATFKSHLWKPFPLHEWIHTHVLSHLLLCGNLSRLISFKFTLQSFLKPCSNFYGIFLQFTNPLKNIDPSVSTVLQFQYFKHFSKVKLTFLLLLIVLYTPKRHIKLWVHIRFLMSGCLYNKQLKDALKKPPLLASNIYLN